MQSIYITCQSPVHSDAFSVYDGNKDMLAAAQEKESKLNNQVLKMNFELSLHVTLSPVGEYRGRRLCLASWC